MPEVRPGDDLAALLAAARGGACAAGDVLVVAHKVVSKAEGARAPPGRRRGLGRARASSPRARGKDPRQVQVVLDETAEVVRAEHGVLICRTRHGFVCANAGVDASNAAGADDASSCCRATPTRSARALRAAPARGRRPAVVVTDSSAARGATASATSRSAWPASRRSRTGAGAATPTAASCGRLDRGRRRGRGRRRPRAPRKDSREPAVVVARPGAPRHRRRRPGRGGARAPARRGPVPLA